MKRVLEPELMNDEAQAVAYANADFNATDAMFVDSFAKRFGTDVAGCVLDLGCGPGNMAFRIAQRFAGVEVHAVDGAAAMLAQGAKILQAAPDICDRVRLIEGLIPGAALPNTEYDAVVSNSLLHHLPDPSVLWTTVLRYARPGAPVLVMDLARPSDEVAARELQRAHTGTAAEILQEDFYNSLLAAFEPGEIQEQLKNAGIDNWSVDVVTDRHVIIAGRAPKSV